MKLAAWRFAKRNFKYEGVLDEYFLDKQPAFYKRKALESLETKDWDRLFKCIDQLFTIERTQKWLYEFINIQSKQWKHRTDQHCLDQLNCALHDLAHGHVPLIDMDDIFFLVLRLGSGGSSRPTGVADREGH